MSYYVTNENSFLNINNAHLKVSGNVHADVMKIGAVEFAPIASNVTTTTNFTNVETGLTTSSNLHIGGTLTMGTVEVIATTHNLENTTTNGNITPHTVEFTNPTTSLVASGNVEVGGNATVSGFVGTSGTGAIVVPSGTTAQQPTGLMGMIRFNSTVNRLELYNGTLWQGVGGISATGGTVTTDDRYKIHTFTTGGTFTVISGGEVDYLVVAGGGGGGNGGPSSHEAGGGGAGGLLAGTLSSLQSGSYTVTVGGGGAVMSNGSNSSINFPTSITAVGGGRGDGGGGGPGVGGNGGSGGGGRHNTAGGNGTSGQGNNGGGGANFLGTSGTYSNSGGGGGGAGLAGGQGGVTDGGNGIQFTYYNHKGSPAGWFAGGGRGVAAGTASQHPSWTAYGGGGSPNAVVNSGTATAGVANTGGGGGGAWTSNSTIPGGAGGSGIVIIRYLT